jgi:hypothetical protein
MLIVILFWISIPFLWSDKNIVDIVSSEELIE